MSILSLRTVCNYTLLLQTWFTEEAGGGGRRRAALCGRKGLLMELGQTRSVT